jgi:hypothetical protein
MQNMSFIKKWAARWGDTPFRIRSRLAKSPNRSAASLVIASARTSGRRASGSVNSFF